MESRARRTFRVIDRAGFVQCRDARLDLRRDTAPGRDDVVMRAEFRCRFEVSHRTGLRM
jgi:hypothetical protein